MALFPCTLCGARYPGASQAAYPSVVTNGSRWGAHLRLCRGCFDSVQEKASRFGIVFDDDPAQLLQMGLQCTVCDELIDGEAAVLFVTAYPHKSERWDATTSLHIGCGAQLVTAWGLSEKG